MGAPCAERSRVLTRAVERMPDGLGLFAVERDLRAVYANAAFARLLALTPETLNDTSLTALFHDSEASRAVGDAVREGARCSARVIVNDPNGDTRWVAVALSPLDDADSGAPSHWLCSVRDSTLERDMERERSERERLSAVALLAAGLSHEINNPLASITTNLEWLVATLPTVRPSSSTPRPSANSLPALSAALVDALAGAERIEASVRQLNALIGAQHEAAELLDVRVLLDAALREVEPLLSGIEVRRDYGEVAPILGGEARIKHAFAQLLANAAQAIAPDAKRRRVDVSVRPAGDSLRVEIDDSGSGVAAHLQNELFRPFVTTKPLGLGKGLGLYLARASIEAAGGSVGFSALNDGGTRFWVELPVNKSAMRNPLDSNSDLDSVPSSK
ncbi:MAG: PAS domain-containing sensor histidine kinase [Polyangiaceae bacterium]